MSRRRTKIVATLGPACWEEPTLTDLLDAGVDVARINCSHADHASIRRQISRVRRSAMRLGKPVSILLDLQGPKIRTSKAPEPLDLPTGSLLTVKMDPDLVGEGTTIGTTYPEMAGDVSAGDRVLFADGALAGEVESVDLQSEPASVHIRMTHGGRLGSHKGINLPEVDMSISTITEKDIADLEVGVEAGVDYVALSFVRRARDVLALRRHLRRLGREDMKIIAKIERPEAVTHIHEIVANVDGVMVARGDLGVEVSLEKVPVYQKEIIESAFRAGRLVITATQMLDSMERNPRPTRAETTDVANAILDGTDAVMLSGETSIGSYPVQAVRTMDSIAVEVEQSRFFPVTPPDKLPVRAGSTSTIIRAACEAVREVYRPLVVFTWSGDAALLTSKARPKSPLFALTTEPTVVDQLALVWGVTPLLVPAVKSTDELITAGEEVLLRSGHLKAGDEVVMVSGRSPFRGAHNILKVFALGGH